MALIKSTDLDFNNIKTSLKDYFKQQSEFADYDFEASGLSNILDVLAYNTHINGLIANLGINESFLTSAQLRSSVVSHAETLGYYPRSKTGASATVTIKAATSDTVTASHTLPANTTFTATVDDVVYTFQTLENYIASNDGSGNFVYKTTAGSDNIVIKEGSQKTKTFIVGDTADNQVYIIPEENIDTSTISVKVFDTTTGSTFTTYTDIQKQVRINTDSTVFIVRESPNGFFELTFSDGNVLGRSPKAGNKIEVKYLTTKGAAANNATSFTANNKVTINSVDYALTVTKVSNSAGGAEKETIESIKANAPVAFATQQRLVTAEDYKALILQRYSSTVEDVIAWGGNDNVPATYGNVYVALKFKTGVTAATQTSTKDNIKSQLANNLGIMSIDTIFATPQDTFIEIATTFNFDPDLTGDTIETTQTNIQNTVNQFFTDNLNKFGATFRKSVLLAKIDDLSPAILNSIQDIKVQQRLVPTLNKLFNQDIIFPVTLATPDDVNYRLTTSNFTFDGKTCSVRNKLKSSTLELVDGSTGSVIRDNVGSYDAASGKVTLTGLTISAFEGDAIKISVKPADENTIRPLRNYILKVDSAKSSTVGTTDFQNTAVTL
jgi:hypothetical protein